MRTDRQTWGRWQSNFLQIFIANALKVTAIQHNSARHVHHLTAPKWRQLLLQVLYCNWNRLFLPSSSQNQGVARYASSWTQRVPSALVSWQTILQHWTRSGMTSDVEMQAVREEQSQGSAYVGAILLQAQACETGSKNRRHSCLYPSQNRFSPNQHHMSI
jgi:hypothetical protein